MGRLFSVALSLGFPQAGVTRRRCLLKSGLSSGIAPRGHPAIREMPSMQWYSICQTKRVPNRILVQDRIYGPGRNPDDQ